MLVVPDVEALKWVNPSPSSRRRHTSFQTFFPFRRQGDGTRGERTTYIRVTRLRSMDLSSNTPRKEAKQMQISGRHPHKEQKER